MEWNKIKHELICTDRGYELIFYLPDNFEELSKELDMPDSNQNQQKIRLLEYIKKIYPNINVQTVKFMAGAVLMASIALPAHPQNKVHAYQTQIVNKSNQNVTVVMGNYYIKPDIEAFLYKDRVMMPVRAIAEVLGADVSWNEKENMVTIKRESRNIKLWIGSKLAIINNQQYNMDVEPMIVSSRVMVPIRFVADAFKINLSWESRSNTVNIDYDKEYTLTYIVEQGDTLNKIANRFGISIQNLKLWNNIKGDIIYSGQLLRVASPALEPIVPSIDEIEIKQYNFDTVLGYTVKDYPSHTSSYKSLSKYHNRLTEISTFTHKVQSDGSLKVDYMQDDVLNLVENKSIDTFMVVHNADSNGFSKELGRQVLSSKSRRKILIDNIYSQLVKHGYSGVEIDFENLPAESKDNYSQFIKELSETLKPNGYSVACAIPAKTGENNESWLKAYDYKAIGKYADRVLIMSYDQHWSGGAAGPIASIDWFERVTSYSASTIPNDKLVMGIALYGYDWPMDGNKGKSVTVSTVNKYVDTYGGKIEWDDNSKSPYYRYSSNGVDRIVWFENVQSAQFKFEIVKKYGLKGVGMWRLGLENNEFWTGIKSK